MKHLVQTILYTVIIMAISVGSGDAQTRVTDFDPGTDSFGFSNYFTNIFTQEIQTNGLCGGMIYAAMDYYSRPGVSIPPQGYRPAQGSVLRQYLYDRNVHQIMSNLDRWIELGANPLGVRSSEYFGWGLQRTGGGQLEALLHYIDRNQPVPLGLQGCGPDCCDSNGDKCSGNHVVLAIGYELGTERSDVKITVYDPNLPNRTMTLEPRMDDQFFTYAELEGQTNDEGKAMDKRWLTYFVDANYNPHVPPTPDLLSYPADGLIHALVVHFSMGDDDLRGGNDNASVTFTTWDGRRFAFPNVNNSNRWLGGSEQAVLLELGEGVRREHFKDVIIETTLDGGASGDNWDLDHLSANPLPDIGGRLFALPQRGTAMVNRFTGDEPNFMARLSRNPDVAERESTTLERGFDRPGFDYRQFAVAGGQYRQGCQRVCEMDDQCQAWTFNTASNMCYLKHDLPPKRPQADAVSGIKLSLVQEDLARAAGPVLAPPAPPAGDLFAETDRTTAENRYDRPGSDYRNFTVPTGNFRLGCQRECETDGRCAVWTFIRSTNTCYLKNGLTAKVANADAVSGIRLSLILEDVGR